MPARITKTRIERVGRLSAADRDAMFGLLDAYYDKVTRADFDRDLDEKRFVIRMFGVDELAGFSTIQLLESEHGGRRILTVFSGDTVIARPYWGQKQLQIHFTRFLIKLRLRHPFRRVFWFLISKGYKTYLLMRNNLTCYPNHEGPTPADVKQILDHVAALKYPDRYDPQRGVIGYPDGSAVKPEAHCLEQGIEQDPDIQFFLQANPGWIHGDELCCLAEIRMSELAGAGLKYALRWRRKKPSATREVTAPQ
jgi:hypothetical protein